MADNTDKTLFPCPCCASEVLTEVGAYEICDGCGWEDDPEQRDNPDYSGGANRLSLNQYREEHQKLR
ncbi:CPCC family cysteine-rich protein [Bradyrhizobium sp. CER78]|uniref:CPCC family cysteine-rich protein n=1 Tax=Bradyrhizobium sp. CER78 TaxID=3039162 RepID=UPI002446ACC9|nr:CPCC family cysteine-rich protein [Bradyrhizobium sp. CER78]MDH2380145.1 CPCC family cysteine-rich protein [Bradyrhizobium sp. CER78]